MKSRIFKRKDGSYTMNEFEDSEQNISVIPPKFSEKDDSFEERLKERIK
ncbi:MAG: hypothetical protein ACQER9_01705 [Nanobdellota archaeon]